MVLKVALILSVLLQFIAAIIVISLYRKTKFNITWMLISLGFILMAFRRLFELIGIIKENFHPESMAISWTAVLISILMFVGSFYIRRIFSLQARIEELRKTNDARVLSAIISTEEKERQKFSEELHDGLGPLLSTIKMGISAIDKGELNGANAQIVERTEAAIDNVIASIKEISNNISPHILRRYGLEKAVKTFINSLITSEDFSVEVSSNLEGKRFNYDLEVVMFRIIGELLTNTLKHASALKSEISMYLTESELELMYQDDGVGFEYEEAQLKGMGLFNIQSRVKSLGGTIEIYSQPNEGFYLKAIIPV